jgi:hypothetical protein
LLIASSRIEGQNALITKNIGMENLFFYFMQLPFVANWKN